MTSSAYKNLMLPILLILILLSAANADDQQRDVTFDYAVADTLSALHQPPIALAGLAQYRQLYKEHLLPDTFDLGLRFQPNLEYLASLKPDDIVIAPPAHLNLEDKLSRIAHVVKIRPFMQGLDVWLSLEQLTREVGELNGGQQQAEAFIDSVEARMSAIAAQIGRPAETLLIIEIRDNQHVRVYGPGSLEDAALTRLGFENAWQGPTNNWGFSTLSVREAFALTGQIVVLQPAYSQDISGSTLPKSGLWQHWLDDTSVSMERNYWPWGGFPSMLRFAESLQEALQADTQT
ncbi:MULTISPECIES: ABC transporter substrate-binding protein [Halomonadaceae]|uniref:ABC transporter substrate-binding protein n=1 Tax=Halomonadaceae TaxID=28256 RepID=UPI000B5B2634|nr:MULTISPECIES: ABC transporter substrate-binding protein [unclassified Halomonas]ASK19666.1 ABC transporter substrate-binding protein [Halomonas sp. N3-2A]UTD53828.1 ABC transporter substrate-binding protein [Halomonas sp. MS1]